MNKELAAQLHSFELQAVKLEVKVETSDEQLSSETGVGTMAV